jgi:DNA-binding NarL/FixJ family response regulator
LAVILSAEPWLADKSIAEGNSLAATLVTLVDDIFFLAKIRETAKAIGVTVVAGHPRLGTAGIAEANPQAVIMDLNSRNLTPIEWIRSLKADPATNSIRIIGFASHVEEKVIADARAAGCDAVMARSAFTQQLPSLLRSLLT